jgi:hypothetical protein
MNFYTQQHKHYCGIDLYCPREGSAVFETGRMSSGKVWA